MGLAKTDTLGIPVEAGANVKADGRKANNARIDRILLLFGSNVFLKRIATKSGLDTKAADVVVDPKKFVML